jgi:methionyl-tRNA formyltransferase
MPPLRIIFMGTAGLACPSLEVLTREPEFLVAAAVTRPDRPGGRDLKLRPSPVKALALRLGLTVLQPEKAREDRFMAELRRLQPDLIAVAAFGQILPPAILDLPRFGCVNVHTSLLPKFRGAAPIQWAILNDEPETGVTIMKMDPGLDTGDILTQERTPITAEDNAETLHDRLAAMGARMLVPAIRDLAAGKLTPRKQPAEGASYARKIVKEDGQLDWKRPARSLWNRVRAFTPWPGAFTHLPAQPRAQLLKLWKAEVAEPSGAPGHVLQADKTGIVIGCDERSLRVQILQLEGGRRMTAAEFLAGHPVKTGTVLG